MVGIINRNAVPPVVSNPDGGDRKCGPIGGLNPRWWLLMKKNPFDKKLYP